MTKREKDKAKLMGNLASVAFGNSAFSLIGDLGGNNLGVSELHARVSVLDAASKYVIYSLVILIEELREVLGSVTYAAHEVERLAGNSSPSVPHMTEFFSFAWSERNVVMRKRQWP